VIIKSILVLLLFSLVLQAKHLHKEKVYQEHFCKALGGVVEHILPDRTRVDCLLDAYAIEVDFAQKWAESIGQSLYYASQTSRKAAVLLIMEDRQKDEKYLRRLEDVSHKYNIDIWTIDKEFKIERNPRPGSILEQ
jgi:hypothetical protein